MTDVPNNRDISPLFTLKNHFFALFSRWCSQKTYKIAFVILAVALLAFVFLGGGAGMIAKPFIESKLQEFSKNIAAQASQSGDIANFSYGEIEIVGGLFSKKAIIRDPRLEYTARLPFSNPQRTDVFTSKAEVSASEVSDTKITVVFTEPFTIARKDYAPIKLVFAEPPKYHLEHDGNIEKHEIELPNSLSLSPEGEGEDVAVNVSYKSPRLERSINHKERSNQTVIAMKDISISSTAENKTITIESINGKSEEAPAVEGKRQFKSSINLDNVLLKNASVNNGPYSFALDIDGKYPLSAALANGDNQVKEMDVAINALNFTTQGYQLKVKGMLSQKPDDQMLSGNADIDIQGLDVFRNSEFIPMVDSSLKDAIITAITGSSDVNTKAASFSLKREHLGTFYIGNTSFEGLVGLIITHSLTQKHQTPNPTLPLNPTTGE